MDAKSKLKEHLDNLNEKYQGICQNRCKQYEDRCLSCGRYLGKIGG